MIGPKPHIKQSIIFFHYSERILVVPENPETILSKKFWIEKDNISLKGIGGALPHFRS